MSYNLINEVFGQCFLRSFTRSARLSRVVYNVALALMIVARTQLSAFSLMLHGSKQHVISVAAELKFQSIVKLIKIHCV